MGRIADDKRGFNVNVNRREMIKSAIKASGVAYVAPMILASAVPASAQVSQGPSPQCQGATCATFDDFPNCSADTNCFCWTLSTGGGFCGQDFFCVDVQNCGEGNSCPEGFVCAVDTCCVVPKCTAVSSLCAANPVVLSAPLSGNGMKASGR